jgi:hypothetical protein
MRSQIQRVGKCNVLGASQVRIATATKGIRAVLLRAAIFARDGYLSADCDANRSRRSRRLCSTASMHCANETRLGMLLARLWHSPSGLVPQPVARGS